jgi:hypothetical protein
MELRALPMLVKIDAWLTPANLMKAGWAAARAGTGFAVHDVEVAIHTSASQLCLEERHGCCF